MAKPEKMPRGLSVLHQDGGLALVYRNHRLIGLFLLLAGLFWSFMLVPAARVIFGGESSGPRELMAFAPFLGATVGFCYVGLAKLLNSARILFTPETVKVSHQPIPWFGAVEVPIEQVKGFLVHRDLKPRDLRHRVTVALVAELADGKKVPLLRAISDGKAAKRMHHEAGAYLAELRGS